MLELRLFGYPAVVRDQLPLAFDTRKALALLAVLAVTGLEHSRDALATMLWPELDRNRARAALRRTLSVTTSVGPALQVTPSAVRLDLDAVRCDVRVFRQLAVSAEPGDAACAVETAADAFLAGFGLRDSAVFEDWQRATSNTLRDELSAVLARLIAESVAGGDLSAALDHARRRTRIDPLSEPAHTDLIRVLAWSGDRAGALAAYRELVRVLDRELGVPPLPETLALQGAIRGGLLPPPSATRSSARPEGAAAPRPAPILVGRSRELAQLDTAWRTALRGGGTIGIVGDPGMGKTALSRAVVDRCTADGAATFVVAGHAAERPLAYAAASDLMRAILGARPALGTELGRSAVPLGALASGLDGDGRSEIRTPGDLQRLHEAFRSAVEALTLHERVLLVVDDAHLLDTPSAALIGYLARRPPRGLLLVATWARGAGSAPLPRAVAESGRVVPLPPLDVQSVMELLGATARDADEVMRRTRGVPLLVREYATADPAVGVGARELVAARFDAAADLTRQVVGAVAVIGTVADPELVRAACGRDEPETVDAIEDAIARGLLVERADRPGYDVPHDLVRDVAHEALSLARRRLLHGRVADLLTRRHGVDALATPAGAVALHLAQAGRDEQAAVWYAAAAAQSSRVFAHAEALDQLRSALALGYSPLDAHEAVGGTLVRLGRYGEALVALDQAAALADGDPMRQAAIEHAIAEVHDRLGDWALARVHLEAARDLIAERSSDRHARILADLALTHHRLGHRPEAVATATRAEREAVEVRDDAALAQANNVLGVIAEARGAHAEARDRLTHAVELARGIDELDLQIAALNNLSRAAAGAGGTGSAEIVRRSVRPGRGRRSPAGGVDAHGVVSRRPPPSRASPRLPSAHPYSRGTRVHPRAPTHVHPYSHGTRVQARARTAVPWLYRRPPRLFRLRDPVGEVVSHHGWMVAAANASTPPVLPSTWKRRPSRRSARSQSARARSLAAAVTTAAPSACAGVSAGSETLHARSIRHRRPVSDASSTIACGSGASLGRDRARNTVSSSSMPSA